MFYLLRKICSFLMRLSNKSYGWLFVETFAIHFPFTQNSIFSPNNPFFNLVLSISLMSNFFTISPRLRVTLVPFTENLSVIRSMKIIKEMTAIQASDGRILYLSHSARSSPIPSSRKSLPTLRKQLYKRPLFSM